MKKTSIVLLGLLAILLNSCVYSLFPIYTEDTLVFKEELVGIWDLGGDSYMIIQKGQEDNDEDEGESDYKYTIEIDEGFTMSSNDPIFIEINGEKVYEEDRIREEMLRRMAENEVKDKDEETADVDQALLKARADSYTSDEFESKLTEKLIEKGASIVKKKELEYEGSVMVYEEKSYRLTVVDEKKETETEYTAHLVDIGGDLFLDLYPITNYNSQTFSDNFFPVHTFYKVEITQDEFTMIHFDLNKLNDLFESNLIRLRHENVEGTILITAQPKELQKFFDKYADDESVFDSRETFKRATL